MDFTVTANVIVNGSVMLICTGIVGFFIKKWINGVDINSSESRKELLEIIKEFKTENKDTFVEIKQQIKDNKNDREKGLDEIKILTGDIFNQLRLANGRTGKIETGLAVQVEKCNERTEVEKRIMESLLLNLKK
jgi:hypothetical protein